MYGMKDPLECLNQNPPSKTSYKEYVITKITSFHERELRNDASSNSLMPYFNVNTLGLKGRLHPAVTNVTTTHNV